MNADAPVRVLLIAGTLTPGGAEKQLAYHVRALTDAGIDVALISLDGEGHYGAPLAEVVSELVYLDESWGRLRRLWTMIVLAREFSPDYVQATHTYANLYAYATAKSCGALSIGALRGDLRTTTVSNGWLSRWHFVSPDAVVANSERASRELTKSLGKRHRGVYLLGNVIDIEALDRLMRPREDLREIAGATADDVLVLGVGMLINEKAFARFLRVIEMARATHPDLKGVIIGDGPEMERLERMTENSPLLGAGLILAGRHAEAFRFMHGADIFLLTSESEGVPNVLLEAMGAGLPSVVTPAGDAGTLVTRSASGFVGEHDDERGLAKSLAELAESRDRRDELGKCARRYAVDVCDLRRLWPSMRDIYADIARLAGRPCLAERVAGGGRV